MSIYKDLDAITDMALHSAKEHGVNYNVILFNPDENGQFDTDRSTFEFVTDSYFEKERPNVILLKKTDDLIEAELQEIQNRMFGPEPMMITNPYADQYLDFVPMLDQYQDFMPRSTVCTYTRETPKVQNNQPCHCGSGVKFKKCCK